MRTAFVLPACNYNIVLSKEDLEQLLEKGYITRSPSKTDSIFVDEFGVNRNTLGHHLSYNDAYDEQPVQFISIAIEK